MTQPFAGIAATLLAFAAVGMPLLWAVGTVPDSVFLNQIWACAGWGAWMLASLRSGADAESKMAATASGGAALAAALAAVSICLACAAWRFRQAQGSATLLLGATIVVLLAGFVRRTDGVREMTLAWLLAGLCSTVVAVVQYFAPELADGGVVAFDASPGRAIGNMRQPNHLSTALMCAIVMTAWRWQVGATRPIRAAAAMIAMVLGVALSASRTGALSLGVLVLWAALDRNLPRGLRRTLALAPLVYLLFWAGLAQYAVWQQSHFYAAERLQAGADISSSRFAIWRDALVMIAHDPWTGVGWGNFNFAWTFTALPDRPVAFFDHTHNLPLQLFVEVGVPVGAAILVAIGWAFWRSRIAWTAPTHVDSPARAMVAMLAVLFVHSGLEYPLWYAYFLLPAAWAFGVVLALGSADIQPRSSCRLQVTRLAGGALIVGSLYALHDHRRIERIFSPPNGADSLAARIEDGQRSVLFGQHADYAAVTTEPRDRSVERFARPLHQLIDTRLLIAYAQALHAVGRHDEALYAAQRLREFRRDDAQAFFKDCLSEAEPPWQCGTAPPALTWRNLEP